MEEERGDEGDDLRWRVNRWWLVNPTGVCRVSVCLSRQGVGLFLISSRQRIQMGGGEGGSCFLSFVANGCRCDDLVFLRLSHPSRARALQVSGRHRDPITIPPVPKASVNLGV